MAAAQPPRAARGSGNQGQLRLALPAVAAAEKTNIYKPDYLSSHTEERRGKIRPRCAEHQRKIRALWRVVDKKPQVGTVKTERGYVFTLLWIADWMVRHFWRKGKDPDSFSIPYLTALGDLLGTALLALSFHFLWLIGDRDGDLRFLGSSTHTSSTTTFIMTGQLWLDIALNDALPALEQLNVAAVTNLSDLMDHQWSADHQLATGALITLLSEIWYGDVVLSQAQSIFFVLVEEEECKLAPNWRNCLLKLSFSSEALTEASWPALTDAGASGSKSHQGCKPFDSFPSLSLSMATAIALNSRHTSEILRVRFQAIAIKYNEHSLLSFLCKAAGVLCLPRRLELMDAAITGGPALGAGALCSAVMAAAAGTQCLHPEQPAAFEIRAFSFIPLPVWVQHQVVSGMICRTRPGRGILWKSHTEGAKEPHVAREPQFADHGSRPAVANLLDFMDHQWSADHRRTDWSDGNFHCPLLSCGIQVLSKRDGEAHRVDRMSSTVASTHITMALITQGVYERRLRLVLRADVLEELGGHLVSSSCGLGVGGELQVAAHARQLQDVVGILLQRLVLAHEVVVDVARVAERVDGLPVLVEGLLALGVRVDEIGHELLELDVVAPAQGLLRGVLALAPDDLGAVALVEGRVVLLRELVAVGGHQPLEGLADEQELQVAFQAVVDLGDAVLVEGLQVGRDVRLVGRDLHGVAVLAPPGQDHHEALPVGAGHLGHVAVDELVVLVHHQVLQVAGRQHAPLAAHGAVGPAGVGDLVPPHLVQDRRVGQLELQRGHKRDENSVLGRVLEATTKDIDAV
ncbi:hypothetical protein QTO34_017937 [Cnephaeus nilssonii]|uniref:Solute carrier family 41 member n=1 Tax=Cnephaeus nilssonii TaxID=3371016 RepID=A0AA40LRN4_CNENI|nr:hypothetical protein QTO34_017937 [Eptesicus nilssonii]